MFHSGQYDPTQYKHISLKAVYIYILFKLTCCTFYLKLSQFRIMNGVLYIHFSMQVPQSYEKSVVTDIIIIYCSHSFSTTSIDIISSNFCYTFWDFLRQMIKLIKILNIDIWGHNVSVLSSALWLTILTHCMFNNL